MSKVFRQALEDASKVPEGEEGKEKDFIVMSGPLSEIYTQALNKVYAKPDPITGTPAIESAANDQLMLQALAEDYQGQQDSDQTGGVTTVYGVTAQSVTDEDVVNITQELAGEDRVVLIMDGVVPGPNSPDDSIPAERIQILGQAMECMVLAHKGKGQVFHSLAEYAASRRKA